MVSLGSFGSLASKIFGSSNERRVRVYRARVEAINALEPEISKLSDDALRARTDDFRRQVKEGTDLDTLLVPAFATVREAAKRALGQRHFDVQLIGGMVLHHGKIAEMKTGEGKTLVATLPVYLNALSGRGVHVVTVNDYLAKRDSEWMGKVYRFLGLTVGCIVHGIDDEERLQAYACDVTYGTNNELGFDYLRDNMKMSAAEMVQFGGRAPELAGHNYAIVDEVDSILIDEARTPLIISGPVEDRAELYLNVDELVKRVVAEHDVIEREITKDFNGKGDLKEILKEKGLLELDEKQRQASLTELGNERIEVLLGEAGLMQGSLFDIENVTVVHHVNQALKAHKLFQRDRDYIVRADQVVIIDEFTGRMMPGRRYSEGLHQALEAKEHVEIQPENQTLASITFQNYFRLYSKLAGMTGTASTEASEFMDIYGLDVVEIPTNVTVSRIDDDDEIYRTQKEKLAAIVATIADCRRRGQPMLVGTVSIEKSEQLSALLKDRAYIRGLGESWKAQAAKLKAKESELKSYLDDLGSHLITLAESAKEGDDIVPHHVLNARFHEQEAMIVAQAGVPGAITIATNMAGRGTDIQLGGNIEARLRTWQDEEAEAGRTPSEAEIAKERARIEADVKVRKKEALDAGGLYVIGTERHESRRIDNQLRGRSGRQGDPGHSKFYLALDDDLMRIFGSEKMDTVLRTLGLQEGEAITHPWMNKSLEMAQKKVEARNFDIRKQILKYDDVLNDQRKVIFDQRIGIMNEDDVSETVSDMRHQVIGELVRRHIPEKAYAEQWDSAGLKDAVRGIFNLDLPIPDWAAEEGIADAEIEERIRKEVDAKAAAKVAELGPEMFRHIEKMVLLQTLDHLWREHIVTLDHLRQVIGFRAYGQRDPLNEYKSEAFVLFEAMLAKLREATTGQLMHIELAPPEDQPALQPVELPEMHPHHIDPVTGLDEFALAEAAISGRMLADPAVTEKRPQATRGKVTAGTAAASAATTVVDRDDPATWGKVSRNALCPCGSGKKYKHCHGKHE